MILVTGATGFLGRRVCRNLDARGLSYHPTALRHGVDLRDRSSTFELFRAVKPDYVLNCAAFVTEKARRKYVVGYLLFTLVP